MDKEMKKYLDNIKESISAVNNRLDSFEKTSEEYITSCETKICAVEEVLDDSLKELDNNLTRLENKVKDIRNEMIVQHSQLRMEIFRMEARTIQRNSRFSNFLLPYTNEASPPWDPGRKEYVLIRDEEYDL